MALSSMTGFARAEGAGEGYRWTWELRSVNGKGLDLRFRLAPGFEDLEPRVREILSNGLGRGNVQASLSAQHDAGAAGVRINEAVLAEVLAAIERIGARTNAQPPTADGILSVRGVVESLDIEHDEETRAAVASKMMETLGDALAALLSARAREGSAIAAVLDERVAEIERLVQEAERSPARTPEAIRARLTEQVAMLLDAAPSLEPDRLHQEAVILATKADIREELDRLNAHVAGARELLAESAPVGRRLDFLAQEFNREVNTLCSKSNDRELTTIGLKMKAVVDQMREQIQNLE